MNFRMTKWLCKFDSVELWECIFWLHSASNLLSSQLGSQLCLLYLVLPGEVKPRIHELHDLWQVLIEQPLAHLSDEIEFVVPTEAPQFRRESLGMAMLSCPNGCAYKKSPLSWSKPFFWEAKATLILKLCYAKCFSLFCSTLLEGVRVSGGAFVWL